MVIASGMVTSRTIFSVGIWKPCACFFWRSVRRRKAAIGARALVIFIERIGERELAAALFRIGLGARRRRRLDLALDARTRLGARLFLLGRLRPARCGGRLLGRLFGFLLAFFLGAVARIFFGLAACRRLRVPCVRASSCSRRRRASASWRLRSSASRTRASARARSRASFSSGVSVRSTTPERCWSLATGAAASAGCLGATRGCAWNCGFGLGDRTLVFLAARHRPDACGASPRPRSWCGHGRNSA